MSQINKAKHLWASGDILGAGRVIFEMIPPEKRPGWVVKLLTPLIEAHTQFPEIVQLVDVASCQQRWSEARGCFESLRNMRLKAESLTALDEAIVDLAEDCAKVVFNESGEFPKFDIHAGWRIGRDVKRIAERLPSTDHVTIDNLWDAFWSGRI